MFLTLPVEMMKKADIEDYVEGIRVPITAMSVQILRDFLDVLVAAVHEREKQESH